MFDRYLSSPRTPRPWRRTGVVLSVAAHVGVGLWLLVTAFWNLERVSPVRTPVVHLGTAAGPELAMAEGGGGPPPPLLRRKPASQPKRVRLNETVQPVPDAVAPDPDADRAGGSEHGDSDTGSPDGVVGGQGKGPGGGLGIGRGPGECMGDCLGGGIPIREPDRCVGAHCGEIKIVPVQLIEGRRVSGNARIAPPDPVRIEMARAGQNQTRASVKMCLDATGRVEDLKIIDSSDYPAYDGRLLGEMRAWRYQPYEVNGRAIPVCSVVTFIYRMQ